MAGWSLLRHYLRGIDRSVTLSWSELDSIVGGLPASAAKHRAWWGGDRTHVRAWRESGFTVENLRMGQGVTFTRVGKSAPAAPQPVPTKDAAPELELLQQATPDSPTADCFWSPA